MSIPSPTEVSPWYLRNINQALGLDEVTGNVYLRSSIVGGNVTIAGNVIVSNVTVDAIGNIDVSGTTMPVSGNINIDAGNVTVLQGTDPWKIEGNVNVTGITEVEIKNDVGNAIPVSWQYGSGASLIPWEVQVARGKIAGVQGLSISGYQAAVPDSWVPIWGLPTSYTYFPAAQQVRVWSSSASDINVPVTVTGLNSLYAPISETVILNNGTIGVLTTQTFFRVNSLNIGQDPMNVGIIYAGNTGKTITLSTIEAGAGRSQMSIYTVPAGYTFYLTQVNVYTNQVGSQTGLYRSYTTTSTGIINIILTFPFIDNYVSRKVVPRPYAEKTDIQWQAQSSQGTSRMGFQVEGYLIANSVA